MHTKSCQELLDELTRSSQKMTQSNNSSGAVFRNNDSRPAEGAGCNAHSHKHESEMWLENLGRSPCQVNCRSMHKIENPAIPSLQLWEPSCWNAGCANGDPPPGGRFCTISTRGMAAAAQQQQEQTGLR